MISFVIGEGSFLVSTPRGCTAVMRIFKTNYVVYVYGGAGLVSVEAYRGVWLVALEVELCAIVATRNYS